jgi:hypothetical protein
MFLPQVIPIQLGMNYEKNKIGISNKCNILIALLFCNSIRAE